MTQLIRHALVHPTVVKSIRTTLQRRGIPLRDIPDGVAEVQARALAHGCPDDVPACRALAVRVARNYAVDEARKRHRRAASDTGLCAEPDLFPAPSPSDSAQEREEMVRLYAGIASGELPYDTLDLLDADGARMRHAAIATELGLPVTTVRRQLRKIRSQSSR